jgi:HK97 family phage major capsid protein
MLARLQAELEERKTFMDGLIDAAQEKGRDLSAEEMELYTRTKDRMSALEKQMEPLREGARIATESARRTAELQEAFTLARNPNLIPGKVEYRSAGAYVIDRYYGAMGDEDSYRRMEMFHRTAAHQTTADNPGLLPESIVMPVVNLVDESRPVVSAIGPQDLPSGSWSYARVTQHTQIGVQSAEKAEMASRKMLVTKTAITAPTYGGYVNVSRQDISRSSPQVLDMIIADLAGQYAIETENACDDALVAGATASAGTTLPAAPTAVQVSAALWTAAAESYTGMQGLGRLFVAVSPDMLSLVGPLFAPVNPQNAQSSGFSAGSFGQGAMGAISGISVVMSVGFAAKTILVINSAGVRVFENRYGALQVVEPSVWGTQVGYAGDFQTLVVEPKGVIKVGTT